MKTIVEIFKKRKTIFKELKLIDLKALGVKKRYEVYDAVDIKNRYFLIFRVERKSRFVSKNALDLVEIYEKILKTKEHNYKYIYVLFFSPFCSKSKKLLQERDFKVLDATL